MPSASQNKRLLPRPSVRTVLLAVHLLILLLPLAGISLLRLYDSILIRQTESELIVQGAALAAIYRQELKTAGMNSDTIGQPIDPSNRASVGEMAYRPALPGLDLARHEVLPEPPTGRAASQPITPQMQALGDRLTPILEGTKTVTLAAIRVLDADGVVVASSGAERGLDLSRRPEVATALGGKHASTLRRRDDAGPPPPLGSISRGTRLRVVVAFSITDGDRALGAVLLSRTPLSVRQALYRDRDYLVGGGLLLLAIVAMISWLTARTISRPIRALIEQTKRVSRGEKGAATPLAHPGTAEVDQISRAVATMAEHLEHRADYIASFAAGVSHEFKTPLTSIRGTVELLRDHLDTMPPEQLERFLDILDKDSARLERLVGRLLQLARADVAKPTEETCELPEVLPAVARRFAADGLEVEYRLIDARVTMAADILTTVLSIAVDNARVHGPPTPSDEPLRVELEARWSDANAASSGASTGSRMVDISVADNGAGISAANMERVFERFFTTGRARGGHGLGLAIVRAWVDAHGGRVELESRPGNTRLTIRLNAQPGAIGGGSGPGERGSGDRSPEPPVSS